MIGDSLTATTTLAAAAGRSWDVLVVGAGPAGALAARGCARRGLRTLLIERSAFPRYKVCGGCLNQGALHALYQAGLGGLPAQIGSVPLAAMEVGSGGRRARLALPEGAAVSRGALDAGLARAAVAAGVAFLPSTGASAPQVADGECHLALRGSAESGIVRGRVLLACDGLGGRLQASQPGFDAPARDDSRFGAGVLLAEGPSAYAAGVIHMACGSGGYVGLVRVESGQLNVAAAFDPAFVRAVGGPGSAAEETLRMAGFPEIPDLAKAAWRGTPLLTRRPQRRAGERCFVLGDAAGYVEPFTGEGMAWALSAALEVVPLAERAARGWTRELASEWERRFAAIVGRRQMLCRLVSLGLRQASLTRVAVGVLARWPGVAAPFVRRINRPAAILSE